MPDEPTTTSTKTSVTWDYSPAPESVKVDIAPRHGLYIDGRMVAPKSRRHFATVNPATEGSLSEIADTRPRATCSTDASTTP